MPSWREGSKWPVDKLITIAEFCKKTGYSEEAVNELIQSGVVFPQIPTRSGILVRRIPSLLTERLFENATIQMLTEEYRNVRGTHAIYPVYIETLKVFSEQNRGVIEREGLLPPDQNLPWKTDIFYTSNQYVHVEPSVIKEARTFGNALVRQFVLPEMTRLNSPESHYAGIDGLYKSYLNSKTKNKYLEPSLRNRFSYPGNQDKSHCPVLCYPDAMKALNYIYYLGSVLPITVWMAVKYLPEIIKSIPMFGGGSSELDIFIKEIDKKIQGMFFRGLDDAMFHNLFSISRYTDQWIAVSPDDKELSCTYESVRLQESQVEMVKSMSTEGNNSIRRYKDSPHIRNILFKYCVQRKFIRCLIENVESQKEDNKIFLDGYISNAIEDARIKLNSDKSILPLALSTGALSDKKAISYENIESQIRDIGIGECDAFILDAANKKNKYSK
jgi:hypothetical protein